MQLDIRLPIGALFSILGVLLVISGLMAEEMHLERSLGHNVNLWWGIVIVAFGAWMLWLARKSARPTQRLAADDPEGRETEAREKRLGLEQ
jgi:protein-S-isoprenylcysteine O-methyltransferase Ste14